MISVVILHWAVSPVAGYERRTHIAITERAVIESVLEPSKGFFELVGLAPDSVYPTVPIGGSGRLLEATELVNAGSAIEDDLVPFPRVFNHFYDPVTKLPLNPCPLPIVGCETSPDWSTERTIDFGRQTFSLRHVREKFVEGLTANTIDKRDKALGHAFQAIGHMIHGVQDAAQPEHSRNDIHPPGDNDALIEARALDRTLGEAGAQLQFTGYPVVTIDLTAETAEAFWFTGAGADGRGISQFSNRNFVTAGTNFTGEPGVNMATHPTYDKPAVGTTTFVTTDWGTIKSLITQTFPIPQPPIGNPREMELVGSAVIDLYNAGAGGSAFISTYSLFDGHMTALNHSVDRVFSLNEYNIDKALDFLIPRAVGYSAGLINYSLRGLAQPGNPVAAALGFNAAGLGTGGGVLSVTNTTAEPLGSSTLGGGTIEVWYDDRATGLRQSAGSQSGVMIPAGTTFDIMDQQSPIDLLKIAREGPVVGQIAIVYRGPMGVEADGFAARVCQCPATEGASDDCEGLCPCSWKKLTTGPVGAAGIPGDGVVAPSFSFISNKGSSYLFDQCFAGDPLQDDITITAFATSQLPAPRFLLWHADGASACFPAGDCGTLPGSASGPPENEIGLTTYNGRLGVYATMNHLLGESCMGDPTPRIGVGVEVCFTTETGCSLSCNCSNEELDALLMCHGPAAFPVDPAP